MPPAAGGCRGRGGAGYSLVVLIMAIAVLNIMIAAALPKWSEMIKRDKEEELISRGWQYAEAIRLFQRRFQRYPVKFDELIKAQPRCIRQLWKDPMTDSGMGRRSSSTRDRRSTCPAPEPPRGGAGPRPQSAANHQAGPIIGVRSRSHQQSLLLFFGHDHYDEWEFRVDLLARRLEFNSAAWPSNDRRLHAEHPLAGPADAGLRSARRQPRTNSMTPPGGRAPGAGARAKPPGAGSGGTIRP